MSGFGVAHAHYHVVPLWDENDITSARYVVPSDHPVAFGVDHLPIADGPEHDHLAALLRTDSVPFF